MKTERAVAYLLLRHLKRFEGHVPRAAFQEVVESLDVRAERQAYLVTWRKGGALRTETLPRETFRLYERGDIGASPGDGVASARLANDAFARGFAEAVFGAALPSATERAPGLEPHLALGVGEMLVFALGVAACAQFGPLAGAALLVCCLGEFAPRGRLWASLGVLGLACVAPVHGALFLAAAYAALQELDPDRGERSARVSACVAACGVAAFRWWRLAGPGGGAPPVVLLVVVAAAVAIAVGRSLYGVHFRAAPLALPFFCLGLALDGRLAGALFGLAVGVVALVVAAWGHRALPVQRERALTPNG